MNEGTAGLSLECELLRQHGELMSGESLRRALGIKSARTFFRAVASGQLPVPVFEVPGRRGRYARTRDVARWLDELGASGATDQEVNPQR